jgi:hypothetical protein
MTPVQIRANHTHLFSSAALPALEEVFWFEMDQHPSRREMLFKTVSTERDIWQSSERHDLELFGEVAEGSEYSFKRTKQGATKLLTIKKMGLGVSISEEMVDDSRFDEIGDLLRKLAKSARETQEVDAMNIFNNGLPSGSETVADGLSILNSAHTLPSGSTFRNVLSTAADLSETALQTAMSDFETVFVGDSGIVYSMRPKILLVHPSNKRYAKELVASEGKPDSADNNMNSLKDDGLMVVSSPHLTDSDAWFLLSDSSETGLRIVSRKPIETKASGPDSGFANDSIFYKARYREKLGCIHPYGIFGTPGA